MKEIYYNTSLDAICKLFGKSRQAWYGLHNRKDEELLQEELIVSWIKELRSDLPRVGGIKLLAMLQEQFTAHHISIGRDAFFAVLRKHHLLVLPRRRYVTTTNSHHHYKKWPDLVQRQWPNKAELVWVSDITYLRTLITDAFSRKIVGYHLSQSLKAKGCISALKKAINDRLYPHTALIHHSDRGIQYCCDAYVELLQESNIQISMTQSGCPYDNAIAERVNGILKSEFGLDTTFPSYSAAIDPVCKAIATYNNQRPHFSCNLNTPEAVHRRESENTLNSVF